MDDVLSNAHVKERAHYGPGAESGNLFAKLEGTNMNPTCFPRIIQFLEEAKGGATIEFKAATIKWNEKSS